MRWSSACIIEETLVIDERLRGIYENMTISMFNEFACACCEGIGDDDDTDKGLERRARG
jgi:hypothetical protein